MRAIAKWILCAGIAWIAAAVGFLLIARVFETAWNAVPEWLGLLLYLGWCGGGPLLVIIGGCLFAPYMNDGR